MIRDFRNKISFFMFFIVNKLKFLYFSIDIDEPTASLDPIAEEELYHHFLSVTKGKFAIFISHRLSSKGIECVT
jgi:ABC-type multidrug transport system fused ATPase/permease subunit